jgi:hypothetical protein
MKKKFVSLPKIYIHQKNYAMPTLSNPIKEAERYLSNARTILSEKAGKDGDLYTDQKYVRMAGNTAWNGVLVALDAVFDVRSKLKKNNQRPDFQDYHAAVAKRDKKMHGMLLAAYDSLHKSMGYDGNLGYKIAQDSLSYGKAVIAWCEKIYTPKP